MYTLFTDHSTGAARVTVPAGYEYVRRQLRKNLITVLRHLRGASYAVRSNHILVKLLTGIAVDPNLPLFEYHRLVSNRLEGITRANGLTSAGKRGQVTDDDRFYGKNVFEALLSVSTDFDLLDLDTHWKSLQSVKVLRHPFNHLSISALDGSQSSKTPTWAVIQIDVVMMAIQYRQWYLAQKRAGEPFIRTVMQFVHEYPLGNALISQLEISLFNRLKTHLQTTPLEEGYNAWPFYLTDLSDKTDKYLIDRIAHLQQRPMTYDDMLQQIKLVDDHRDLYVVSRAPKIAITRQNAWAVNLAVLPILEFMVQCDYAAGSARNYHEAANIKRKYRELIQDRDFGSALGEDSAEGVLDHIDRAIIAYL
jgi:hypothetical protein